MAKKLNSKRWDLPLSESKSARPLPPSALPMRDGVSPSRVMLPYQGQWSTVLAFLQQHFDRISPEIWQARMQDGMVLDGQAKRLSVDAPYVAGAWVFYYREVPQETPIPFDVQILYQDSHLLVIDKPHFLPVTPSGRFVKECVLSRLKAQFDEPDLIPIHRLDRETAGVMLLSRRVESREAYQGLFRRREVQKTYQAIAPYRADLVFPIRRQTRIVKGEPFFCVHEVDGQPNSDTQIELLSQHGEWATYVLKPHTGIQHQLRVHLAALGIPIKHDSFYPVALPDKGDDFSQPLQLLAKTIAFVDPLTGQERVFESRLALMG